MSEIVNVPNYPKSIDTWYCCGERYSRFSQIINHIEFRHFQYRYDVAGYFQNGQGFKYSCEKCDKKGFSMFNAIGHFITEHVEHLILCLQCIVMHPTKNFHDHIRECNLVETEIRRNIR